MEHQDDISDVNEHVPVVLIHLPLILTFVVGLATVFLQLDQLWINCRQAESTNHCKEREELDLNII